MATLRLRYQDGHLVPLDPLPDLKDGDEIEVDRYVVTRRAGAGGDSPPRGELGPAYQTMLASEDVLRRDWDTPEEDAAWAHLSKGM